jgi:hypothetical protein
MNSLKDQTYDDLPKELRELILSYFRAFSNGDHALAEHIHNEIKNFKHNSV